MLPRLYRRLRYAPFLSQVVVTRRCNLACAYCREFDHVSEPVSAEVLRARIDIDPAGVVHWCASTVERFGIPLSAYTVDDLSRQFSTWKPCNARCTIGCARSCSLADRWFPQRGENTGAAHG
jgi:hypothetical protein